MKKLPSHMQHASLALKFFQKNRKFRRLLRFQLPHRPGTNLMVTIFSVYGGRGTYTLSKTQTTPCTAHLISFWHCVLSKFWNSLKLLKYAKILTLQKFLQQTRLSRVFKIKYLFYMKYKLFSQKIEKTKISKDFLAFNCHILRAQTSWWQSFLSVEEG